MLRKGDLFLACFGRNHDAREFIGEAIKAGVTAVLAETGGQWQGTQIIDGGSGNCSRQSVSQIKRNCCKVLRASQSSIKRNWYNWH